MTMTIDEAKERLRWACTYMLRCIAEDSGPWSTGWPERIREPAVLAEECARVLGLDPPVRIRTIDRGPCEGERAVEVYNPLSAIPLPKGAPFGFHLRDVPNRIPLVGKKHKDYARDRVAMVLRDTIAVLDSGWLPAEAEKRVTDRTVFVPTGDLMRAHDPNRKSTDRFRRDIRKGKPDVDAYRVVPNRKLIEVDTARARPDVLRELGLPDHP